MCKIIEAPKKSREYLDDQLADFKREVLSGNYIAPSKMTFKDFYENEWKPKHAVIEYKNGTTLKSHCSKINNHVLPKIGHKLLDEITTMELVKLFTDLRKPGARVDKRGGKDKLSSRTVQYAYDVTMNIFKRSVEGTVIKTNPMDGVKRPQISKENKRCERIGKITTKKMKRQL
ncbi:hypothetical protein KAI37_03406 [Paenibacillus sp. S25]|nr:hypothetical protein KAI37_03406 [Paenibacillus sp. S25]